MRPHFGALKMTHQIQRTCSPWISLHSGMRRCIQLYYTPKMGPFWGLQDSTPDPAYRSRFELFLGSLRGDRGMGIGWTGAIRWVHICIRVMYSYPYAWMICVSVCKSAEREDGAWGRGGEASRYGFGYFWGPGKHTFIMKLF